MRWRSLLTTLAASTTGAGLVSGSAVATDQPRIWYLQAGQGECERSDGNL